MTTRLSSLFAACLLLGASMLACGGGSDNASNAANTAGGALTPRALDAGVRPALA